MSDGISADQMNPSATSNPALSEDEIRLLVNAFYDKIRADPELGPIFMRAITGDWGPHLEKMYDFWSSVMLTSGRYKGNPVAVHQRINGLEIRLFDHWLTLFGQACDETFGAETAGLFG